MISPVLFAALVFVTGMVWLVVCFTFAIAVGRIIRAGNRHLGDGEP